MAASLAILASGVQAATVTGKIAEIDAPAQKVTLDNGVTYDFGNSEMPNCLRGFLPGDSVRIGYSEVGQGIEGRTILSTNEFQSVGKIVGVDVSARKVTLDNGLSFIFDESDFEGSNLTGYAVGDQVRITYDAYASSPGEHTALDIDATHSHELAGVVREVNVGMKTVTLEDGVTYKFDGPANSTCTAGGFLPGDEVILILRPDAEGKSYEAILPKS
jgi:Cu/Ag efflux protein CusF